MIRLIVPEPCSSCDPVLGVLATDSRQILGRDYAAFILLLFGEADEEIATWFSRALCALDSATGKNIACLVLARRVRVRGHLARNDDWPIRGKMSSDRKHDVNLSEITPIIGERLVSPNHRHWHGDERELTAITYGTDDFARSLGIMDKLPCILFIDAIPRLYASIDDVKAQGFELLPLANFDPKDILPFLRRVIQKSDDDTGLDNKLDLILRARKAEGLTIDLQDTLSKLRNSLDKIRSDAYEPINQELGWVSEAKNALHRGAAKHFKHLLLHNSSLDSNLAEQISDLFLSRQQEFTCVCKTLDTLSYYNTFTELNDDQKACLRVVFEKHVNALLPKTTTPSDITPSVCRTIIGLLKDRYEVIIAEVEGMLPDLGEAYHQIECQIAASISKIDAEITTIKQQKREAEHLLAEALHAYSNASQSSIVAAVRQILASDTSSGVAKSTLHQIQDNLRSFSGSNGSQPLFIEAISIENLAIGDQYNVSQAGTVGPYSHSHDINFQQKLEKKARANNAD